MKTKVIIAILAVTLLGVAAWVLFGTDATITGKEAQHAIDTIADYVEPAEDVADTNRISFTTVKGVERATAMLHGEGLHAFMNEAWKQGVVAPGIHSKYWLDQFTRGKPKLYSIEKAYRDFGYEIAVQVEDLAFQIYEKPDKTLELERLGWLLRFSKWMLKPGKFENYRIGIRVEDAATMPLLRASFNLETPIGNVESMCAKFLSAKDSAAMRANILFEESAGVFDVRDLANNAQSDADDDFEKKWIEYYKLAYRHFGNRILDYSLDSEILHDAEIKYNFFMDDGNELGGVNCIPEKWDEKLHRNVCVRGNRSYMMDAISGILTFRKDIGYFPEVKYAAGTDGSDAYGHYYRKKFTMEQKLTTAPAVSVGWLFWQYKTNTFMDKQTRYAYETKNYKRTSIDEFESWHTTRERRALNQQWLKKNRKPE